MGVLRRPIRHSVAAGGCVRRALTAAFFLATASLHAGEARPAQLKPVRRVLILYELGFTSPAVRTVDREVLAQLEAAPFQVELYREYMETTLFPDPASQQSFREWFLSRYRDRRPDLILTAGPTPLQFIAGLHETTFEGIPVVFCATSRERAGNPKLDAEFTGIWEAFEPEKTLEAALRLQPGTKHVFVVGGTTAFDRMLEAVYRARLKSYESSLDFAYLTELTMPDLLERLRHLPEGSIVLITHFGRDAAGVRYVGSLEADPMITGAANAPVFGPSDVDVGHGEVGGYLSSFAAQGKLAGATALRILGGEKPADIPVVEGASTYEFDWEAVKRWGLRENAIPAGSVILNRPADLWEAYKRYVIGGLIVVCAQTLLIAGLIRQRAEQKRSRALLHDLGGRLIVAHEEERYRIARELHDDLSQRMALLEIGLDQLGQEAPGLTGASKEKLREVAEMASEVSSDIHNLSHDLHPPKLESLGLAAAMEGFCREFSRQHAICVRFEHHHAHGKYPKDVTLCLYRVTQEALRNAVKHSGAENVEVELAQRNGDIRLSVADAGVGFNPDSGRGKSGLGLMSMRERLRLVGGRLKIDSEPSKGTRIVAEVPLTEKT